MTKNTPSIAKVLQILRDEKSPEQHLILTYIGSEIGKLKLSNEIDKSQYTELCKLLIQLISKPIRNELNKDILKKSEEAKTALENIVTNFSEYHKIFFEVVFNFSRKEKLRILEILNSIEIKILVRIIQGTKTIKFINDCLQTIQPNIMKWIAPEACTDSIQPLIEAQTRKLTDEEDIEEHLIFYTLIMLNRLYEYATTNSSNSHVEPIHTLLFERVISLAYMGHKRQRTPALKVLNQALNTNFITFIKNQHLNLWTRYKNTLRDIYCTRMLLLVKAVESDWSSQWCLSIKILGIDLHRGAELINNLLNVEEKAFKSTDMRVRRDAFESWNSLIDNFALDKNELVTTRRIKLLCIPLNAKNCKTEIIAIAKLETWWHLIVQLYPSVDKLVNQVIGHFLNFCFGPLGDTPLLSTKCNVVASPGKKFSKAKFMVIDALLQLLAQKPNSDVQSLGFIKERLPNPVSNIIFQASYKSFFHSVGEAALIIDDLNDEDFNNRENIYKSLWSNLIIYIQQSPADKKSQIYKELILIVNEVMSHSKNDSPLIINLVLNIIIGELFKGISYINYRDTDLIDLLLNILSPEIINCAVPKQIIDLTCLICHAVKPKNSNLYHPRTLNFIKSTLAKMELFKADSISYVCKLWISFAEIIIQYMRSKTSVNEGTTVRHNFETVLSMIIFPMNKIFWNYSGQFVTMTYRWRELYQQFDIEADFIVTVKPNEIFNYVTAQMEKCLLENKKCHIFIANCLETLMNRINYEVLLSENKVPPLINIFRETIIAALDEKKLSTAVELSLKATSGMLITVYGLNQTCTLLYLDALKPSFERILEITLVKELEKEIINTWETIVIVLRGLVKLLTPEFIQSYRKIILLGLNHKNNEIFKHTMSLIDIQSDLNEKTKVLFKEFEEIGHESSKKRPNFDYKINENSKNMKIVGCILNRKTASPQTLIIAEKDGGIKKIKVPILPQPPPPPEPDSQDYVVIENKVKLDINRLTEHQKESLKRHRDDIPAMYNDLSQSASRNTHEFGNWVGNNSTTVSEESSKDNANTLNNSTTNIEANKENNVTSYATAIENNNEKCNSLIIEKKLNEDNVRVIENNPMENNRLSVNDLNTSIQALIDQENLIEEHEEPENTLSYVLQITPKKLDFESREEFPDDNDKKDSETKSQTEEQQTEVNSVVENKPDGDAEMQYFNLLNLTKRGRTRGKSVKINEKPVKTRHSDVSDDKSNKNLKRKSTTDGEPDKSLVNKRRRFTISHSSSDTASDTESINSIDGDNHSSTLPNEDLSKRTKKEMSRLQINMVFNSRMPSKLRSKTADDFIYEKNNKRQKNTKDSDKSTSQNLVSQELVTKRKRRSLSNLCQVSVELLKPNQNHSVESDETSSKIKINNESEINDGEKLSDTRECIPESNPNETSTSVENKELDDAPNNAEKSVQESIKNLPPTNSSCNNERNNEKEKKEEEEEEEVIESSQNTDPLLRSPVRRNYDERLNSMTTATKTSPKATILDETLDDTLPDEKSTEQIAENPGKSSQEETNKSVTSSNFTSPKSIKRVSKTKTFMPQCNNRAAHMLGLVTKLAIGEKNESNDKTKCSEDEIKKLKSSKQSETDGTLGKKERTAIIKEPERIGSPSGSRQEKIFNNMKDFVIVEKKRASSPPSKLVSKLKNDGEKVSPKFEKNILFKKSMKTMDNDHNNIESTGSFERDDLPILEWSNANPPSLTASPNTSILKRRQIIIDNDNDLTPNKRKRVSFADPPVSKEMGYEVITGSSPISANSKLGQPRSLLGRKDTPMKVKKSRFRTIQNNNDKEKLDHSTSDKLNESTSTDVEIDHKEIKLTQKITDNTEANSKCSDASNLITTNFSDSETNKTCDENINAENLFVAEITADNTTINSTQSVNETNIDEIRANSVNYQRHSDVIHNDVIGCKNNELKINKSDELFKAQTNNPNNSLKFNITDDITIAEILNGPGDIDKSTDLDDTVDIRNISNLNSTLNSDELFCGKLARTSTQNSVTIPLSQSDTLPVTNSLTQSNTLPVATPLSQSDTLPVIPSISESDTLPVTDSMFFSQVGSQDSSTTQQSLALSQPHTMDVTNSICPKLSDCNEPIEKIVDNLVNPLWTKNLSKYFISRNINTIGDLARLSEREVSRLPVKCSPKADYIKQVLNKFSLSSLGSLENKIGKNTLTSKMCSTPRVKKIDAKIIDDTLELNEENKDDGNVTGDISEPLFSIAHQSFIDSVKNTSGPDTKITGDLLEKMKKSKSTDFGSLIVDTSTEQQTSMSGSKITGSQSDVKDILNEIDPALVLQNAMERNTIDNIIQLYNLQYKMKKNTSGMKKISQETLKMLGLEESAENELKNTCVNYGLANLLERLPKIFSEDDEFFPKVLSAYCKNITAENCINTLDLTQVKQAICQKFSSSELYAMLSTVLINEEKNNINTPITQVSNLNRLLKRIPTDSINNIIANEDLIPSSLILEIALKKNNSDAIINALDNRFPNIVENIMNRNMSLDTNISYINTSQLSKDKLLDIYRKVSDKLSPDELLDVFSEIMKKKMTSLNATE